MFTGSKYFTPTEFDSADLPGSGERMDPDFIGRLDFARALAGIPFRITSGYRTPEHNKDAGGSPTSSHLVGLAADISARTNRHRWEIVSALIAAGFTRIGIAKTFIHVDQDPAKNHSRIWLY